MTATLRNDLLTAAADFAAAALSTLRPDLAMRLAPYTATVLVVTDPPEARLLATEPEGQMRLVYASPPPPDLGTAVARALKDGVAQMSPAAQNNLARLHAAGGRLVVMIDLVEQAAVLAFDPGDADRVVKLATIGDGEPPIAH